jgi:hypothetical protein
MAALACYCQPTEQAPSGFCGIRGTPVPLLGASASGGPHLPNVGPAASPLPLRGYVMGILRSASLTLYGVGPAPFCSRARTSPCSASLRLLIASESRLPFTLRLDPACEGVTLASPPPDRPIGSSRIDASTIRSLSRRTRAMMDASTMIPSERLRARNVREDGRALSPADARSATFADCREASNARRER